jgi:hypothetical protein
MKTKEASEGLSQRLRYTGLGPVERQRDFITMQDAGQYREPSHVLILVRGNKFLDAFAMDRTVTVKIVEVPEVESTEAELMLEQYLALRLKFLWARIFKEGFKVASHAIRSWSLQDEFDKNLKLAFSKELDALKADEVQA